MPNLEQVSFVSGEISPSLHARVDLQRFTSALKKCLNWFVRAQGGISNRQGTQFIYELSASSNAALLPFIRAEDDSYILVLQEGNARVFRDGAFVNLSTSATITNIVFSYEELVFGELTGVFTVTTSGAHLFVANDTVEIASVASSFSFSPNGTQTIYDTPSATTFRFTTVAIITGSYTSGGTATKALTLTTPYQSEELSELRYTQSADVMTICHRGYYPYEIVRTSATAFTFSIISDIDTGPFLDDNTTAVTMKSSAATGTGVTITASSSTFTDNHIGALLRLRIEDQSDIPPWESGKSVSVNDIRKSNGKFYKAGTTATTGTVAPSHESGIQYDGAGNVDWEYLHSGYGVARITAQAGTTATADVLSYIPVVSPDVTLDWAFGAWSEDQGYPGVVTYFGDRLTFARTIEQPQGQWASKTGDYHNFSVSSPVEDSDAITQVLNSRQTNDIVEMVPLEQLISLTANSSWASPNRGESWSPQTIGFFPQSYNGSADLRSVIVGDNAIMAEKGARRLRELKFEDTRAKFGGAELTILSRHLFDGTDDYIVDIDYAKDPDNILWIVLASGKLIGMTYLPEQDVAAFHQHNTDGFFERVCVIPENGIDATYFVVRRTVGGSTVRYLERLATRTDDPIDAFFVDSGLTYDGRNATATTITVTAASFDGGSSVTLTASSAIFTSTDVGDAIQLGGVSISITAFSSATVVTGELQGPLTSEYQSIAISDWAFARDTFSGLGHLEGMTVTGLADGNVIDPDDTTTSGVVTSGEIVLTSPAAVVHIGLPYTADAETLTMNVAGSGQITPNAKIVPQVSIVTMSTLGLTVGPDDSNLEDISRRSFEGYFEPPALATGSQKAYVQSTWNKESRLLLRQGNPLPATILAIFPKVVVGGDG